jgi:hypothetical protein
MENLRKAARVVLIDRPNELSEILKIAEQASSLRGFRDDIVHGQWKLHRPGGKLTSGVRIFKQFPSPKVRELAFSYEKAEDVAAKISVVTVKLVMWCHRNVRH